MCWLQSVLTTGHLKDFVCLCYLSLQAPSDPRYLWTQFSSVDNLYEPSTEASVPLSTFRSERPSFFSFLPPSSRHFWLSSGFCTSVLSFFAAAFFFFFFWAADLRLCSARGRLCVRVRACGGGECAASLHGWINPVRRSAFRFAEVQNWVEHSEPFGSWTSLWGRLVMVIVSTFSVSSISSFQCHFPVIFFFWFSTSTQKLWRRGLAASVFQSVKDLCGLLWLLQHLLRGMLWKHQRLRCGDSRSVESSRHCLYTSSVSIHNQLKCRWGKRLIILLILLIKTCVGSEHTDPVEVFADPPWIYNSPPAEQADNMQQTSSEPVWRLLTRKKQGKKKSWFSQYLWSGDDDEDQLYSPVSPDSETDDEYDDVADVGSRWSRGNDCGLETWTKTETN